MLTLNRKEQRRLLILNELGRVRMEEAAEMMALSLRQVRRLRRAYRP